jgi:hypothetical protein
MEYFRDSDCGASPRGGSVRTLIHSMKRPLFHYFSVPALAVLTSSCVDQDQKFVINPDGSGKFISTMILSVNPQQLGALTNSAGQEPGKQVLTQLIRGSEGVEAWADVKHEQTADGKTKITATAYFPDINKFSMSASGRSTGTGGPQASTLVSRKEGADWIIEVGMPDAAPAASATPAKSKKTPEEIQSAIQQAQQQWQATKGFMAPMMQDARLRTTVVVGGTVKGGVGFSKESDNTALLQFNGPKIVDAIDKMVMDPKMAQEAAEKGSDLMSGMRDQKRMQKVIMESLTDGQGMPRVTATPGSAAFDYKAEVEKAKANQSPDLKALIEEAKKPGGSVVRPPTATPPGATPPGATPPAATPPGGSSKEKVVPPKPKKTPQ